jgi:hypothetical protein
MTPLNLMRGGTPEEEVEAASWPLRADAPTRMRAKASITATNAKRGALFIKVSFADEI